MPTPAELQTCIDNLTDATPAITLAVIAGQVKDNVVHRSVYANTTNDLPSLCRSGLGNGQIVYVASLGVPVISVDSCWTGLDGRILRYDVCNQLWAWGDGFCGGLGINSLTSRSSPVQEVSSSLNWCQVAAGRGGSAVKLNGQLWSWGDGRNGLLGNGATTTRCSPVREITSSTDWCQVARSVSYHAAAIKTTGQLWSWGTNDNGQLGDGTTINKCSPVREICSDNSWCAVSVGTSFSGGIKTNGSLWLWGRDCLLRLTRCVTPGCLTNCVTSPVREVCEEYNWSKIDLCAATGLAIKTNGQLWSWGEANFGQTGTGQAAVCDSLRQEYTSSTDWVQVSAGTALKSSGQIWSWGLNDCGNLGDGTTINRFDPVREVSSSTDWCFVGPSRAIKTNGQLWSWGDGTCGVLGDGTTISKCSPVREITSSTQWCTLAAAPTFTVFAIKKII